MNAPLPLVLSAALLSGVASSLCTAALLVLALRKHLHLDPGHRRLLHLSRRLMQPSVRW